VYFRPIKMRITLLLTLLITQFLAHADTLTGRVVRVTDGDTIVILDSADAQHKIRLTGIDAPERKQAFGTKSKEHLSDWDLQRRQDYFDWAMAVIDRLRGVHGPMETIFDDAYEKRP